MFKKNVNYDVIIGEKAVVTGNIRTEGSVCIDGKVIGDIHTTGTIIVSNNASIEGNINALSVDIFGTCKGDVETTGAITVNASAVLEGDAKCESIRTIPGCRFTGNLTVAPSPETKKTRAERDSKSERRDNGRGSERDRADRHENDRRNEGSKLTGDPKSSDNTKKYSRS